MASLNVIGASAIPPCTPIMTRSRRSSWSDSKVRKRIPKDVELCFIFIK